MSRVVLTGLILALACLPALHAGAAEDETWSGLVIDAVTGWAVADARVEIEGSGLATVSGQDGRFRLPRAPRAGARLVARAAGYYSFFFDGPLERLNGAGEIRLELQPTPRIFREQVVVAATRTATPVAGVPGGVTVLERDHLAAMPGAHLVDALAATPGLHGYSNWGNAFDLGLDVRGFTGGGQSSYLLVLVDGRPVNDLESGLVDWTQIPLERIERIEVHRGPASALYGDTGLGGVVHLFTRPTDAAAATALSASGGSWGEIGGELSHSESSGRLSYSVSAGLRDVDGYRDRSAWNTRDLGASLQIDLSSASELVLSAASHDRESEEPGPLDETQIEDDRRQAGYPIDGEDERRLAMSAHYARRFSDDARLTLDLSHRTKDSDLIRSLPLELQFDDMLVPSSDVKQRDLETRATVLQALYQHAIERGGLRHRFAVGFEAARGALDSGYREVTPALEIGMPVADGDGSRASYAVYAQDQLRLSAAVSLLAGVRYDRFEDEFTERVAEDLDVDATHDALSPKLGVTWSYRPDGDLFAQVGRGFRAPTLDQLFDQRRPFGSNISNTGLEPQKATNYELGLRQSFARRVDVELTLYRLNLKKEIEFDPATFTFGNIGRSRHEGVEFSCAGYLRPGLRAFVAYTLQDATHETAAVPDKQIVRVPRHLGSAGLRYALARGWSGSLTWRVVGRQFLDETNDVALDSYSTLDARLGYRFERGSVFAAVTNLLDSSFATNGFVTPTTVIVPGAAVLDGTVRAYPAPELALRAGVVWTIGGDR